MKRKTKRIAGGAVALAVIGGAGLAVAASKADKPITRTVEFKDAIMRVETNSTDGDAGLQVVLETPGAGKAQHFAQGLRTFALVSQLKR